MENNSTPAQDFAPKLNLPFDILGSGTQTPRNGAKRAGIVVFSGGSAANSLVDVFRTITEEKQRPLSYVIPISDNGGSSSELIRVFGGPGMFEPFNVYVKGERLIEIHRHWRREKFVHSD
jgi:2-phospho-L-lactate transferase CofD